MMGCPYNDPRCTSDARCESCSEAAAERRAEHPGDYPSVGERRELEMRREREAGRP